MLRIKLLVFVLVCTNVSARTLTLDALKENLKNKNYNIKAGKEDVESSKSKVLNSKAAFYPKFGIEAGKEFLTIDDESSEESRLSLYGELNLFRGYEDHSQLNKSKFQLQHTKMTLKKKVLESELEIEKLFYQLLFLKKKKTVLRGELVRAKSHIKMVSRRLSSKIITETDLLEFKLYKKKLESLLSYIELEIKSLQNEILTISGVDHFKKVELSGSLPHYILVDKIDDILNLGDKSFSVSDRRIQTSIANEELKITQSQWLPRLDLKVEHGYLDEAETGLESDTISSRALVLGTWEFFSGGKTKHLNQQRLKNYKSKEYLYKQEKLNFKIKARNLFYRLKMLEKTISSEEENARISKSLYLKTMNEYKKGIKDSGALSSSSKEYSEIESRVYQLKLNYVLVKVELEQLVSSRLNFTVLKHDKE